MLSRPSPDHQIFEKFIHQKWDSRNFVKLVARAAGGDAPQLKIGIYRTRATTSRSQLLAATHQAKRKILRLFHVIILGLKNIF